MNERQMTHQESLAIISTMIAVTQQKMQQSGKGQLLLWGYLSLLTTGVVTLAGVLGWGASGWLWLILPAVGLPLSWLYDHKYPQEVSSWRDKIIGKIWTIFAVLFCIVPIISLIAQQPQNIFFIEMLLLTTGSILTGSIIGYRTMFTGGIIGLVIVYISCLFPSSWQSMAITLSLIFIVTLIIPGHAIRTKKEGHV